MIATYTVIFTPDAQNQLDRLYTYIADRGGEARADKYVGAIVAECLSLAIAPQRGHARDDIRPSLRIMGYAKRLTIAFSVDSQTRIVAIQGVFYGGQDFAALRDDSDA